MKNNIKKLIEKFGEKPQTFKQMLKPVNMRQVNNNIKSYIISHELPTTHYKSYESYNADFKNKLKVYNFVSGSDLSTKKAKQVINNQLNKSGSSELLNKITKMTGYTGNNFKRFKGRVRMLSNIGKLDALSKTQANLVNIGQTAFFDRFDGLLNKTQNGQFKAMFDDYMEKFGLFKARDMLLKATKQAKDRGGIGSDTILQEFEFLTRDEI